MRRAPFIVALVLLGGCTTHSAVPCKSDGDCTRFSALCVSGYCAQVDMSVRPGDMTKLDGPATCSDASVCGVGKPICGADQMCHPCVAGDDAKCLSRSPTTPKCDTGLGECVGCKVNGDCSQATAPICESDGSCRACRTDGECMSNICNLDGSCADPNDVVYVDNLNGTCTGSHNGASNDPYCDIQTAITNLGIKKYIRVAGSSSSYPHVSITSGSFTLVGPSSGTRATVTGDASNLPGIGVTGMTTNVTLDGLEVTLGFAGQAGIACSSVAIGPTLTLRRMYVHGVPGAGLTADHCIVKLDRDQIGPLNAGGGIQLSSSQYSITNSFIVGNNLANSPGVSFGSSCTPVGDGFQFNTVAGNAITPSGAGGITCSASGTVISNSIVWGNSKTGGTQLSGNCMVDHVDLDDTTTPGGTGNVDLPPDFVNAGSNDYHLKSQSAANSACCVDKTTSATVLHDFDGTSRPLGARWDIGAHEVTP